MFVQLLLWQMDSSKSLDQFHNISYQFLNPSQSSSIDANDFHYF